MRIETYIPGLSKNTVDIVKHAESLGYDALVSGELNNEPFTRIGWLRTHKPNRSYWFSHSLSKKSYDCCQHGMGSTVIF